MWGNYALGMKFERVTADFFHDVINKQIPIELLLQDKNLVFDQNTIVIIKPNNFVVVSQYNWVVGVENDVNIFGRNLSIKVSFIFLNFEDLGIFIIFEPEIIEEADCRLLFLVDISQNIDLFDFLVFSDFQFGGNFTFFSHFSALDNDVMDEIWMARSWHYKEFFFAYKSDWQNVAKREWITLDNFVLLEVNVVKSKHVLGLNDERNLSSVIKVLIIANVNFLNLEWKIIDIWLWNHWLWRLTVAIDLVFVTQ